MARLSHGSIAILCACAASLAFSFNDSGIKFLSGDYALHEVVLLRSFVAILITVLLIMPAEGGWHLLKTRHPFMQIGRALFTVSSNILFFMGLAAMPLAANAAIFFVAPLIITAFSVIFLGEKVGPLRWLAVGIGLLGVMVMMSPGTSAFRPAALLPFGSAVMYASMHMMTRKLSVTEKASTLSFYVQLIFFLVCIAIGLAIGNGRFAGSSDPSVEFVLRRWIMPRWEDVIILVGIGLTSAAGNYFISQAYRLGEAALIAPFEYLALVMAIVLGYLLFGEIPELRTWIGSAMIMGAGLFVFWRESRKGENIALETPLSDRN